jgi:hypothetical protein
MLDIPAKSVNRGKLLGQIKKENKKKPRTNLVGGGTEKSAQANVTNATSKWRSGANAAQ